MNLDELETNLAERQEVVQRNLQSARDRGAEAEVEHWRKSLATIGRATPFGLLLTLLGLLGFGFALFSSPNTNAVMSSVEPRVYGIASGTLGTMRLLGQMLSMALVLLLFAVIIGEARITPERYPLFLRSAKTAFAIFGVLCAGGVYASLRRGELRSSA